MNICDLISNQDTYGTEANQTVFEVVKAMVSRNIGAVPVLRDGSLVGIFSERDLMSRVVAEGLQDRAAKAILVEAGCDAAQGFMIGRPEDESEATRLLMENAGLADRAEASGEVAAAAEQGHPVDLEPA